MNGWVEVVDMTPLTARESVWVEPLKRQPELVVLRWIGQASGRKVWQLEVSGLYTRWEQGSEPPNSVNKTAPYQPGQIIDGKRITSVECKRVMDVTEDEAEAMGFEEHEIFFGCTARPIAVFRDDWRRKYYPSHPFPTSWCWLIRAECFTRAGFRGPVKDLDPHEAWKLGK